MRSKDIISEVPASAQHRDAIRDKQTRDYKRFDQQQANKANTDSIASGGKNTRVQQFKIDKAAKARAAKSKVGGDITDFAKDKVMFKPGKLIAHPNGLFYQLQKDRSYVEVTGVTKNKATGELKAGPQGVEAPEGGFKSIAPNSTLGKDLLALTKDPNAEVDKSIVAKAKDAAKGALQEGLDSTGMDNLAAKTRSDPNASTAKKAGATVGAGIGRAMANVLKRKPGQAQAKKPVTNVGAMDLKAMQSMIMNTQAPPEQRLQVAQDMISKMSDQHARGVDVNTYLDTLGPALKRSGLQKSNPQEYQAMVTKARSMRNEAYEHMSKVLEAVGLTWEEVGYTVLISETITDNVVLIPTKDLQLSQLKTLAGV